MGRQHIEKYQVIMTPEYVAEAFHSLITSCSNGSALCVARPDVPPFTFPDHTLDLTIILSLGAKMFGFLGVRVFQWYHQLIFFLLLLTSAGSSLASSSLSSSSC